MTPPYVSIDAIKRHTSTLFGTLPIDMVSERRSAAVAKPRQVAMYLARTLTTRSLPEIGRHFGGRDHTTVIHAVRRTEQMIDDDPGIEMAVAVLTAALTATDAG